MPDHENRARLVDQLSTVQLKGNRLRIVLLIRGEKAEAEKVRAATAEVTVQVDALLAQEVDDWTAVADTDVTTLQEANKKLQAAIRKVEQGVDLAANVVKAIGYVDDAVALARKVLGP